MMNLWTAIVFAIIIASIVFLIFWLGPMPGKIARKRGHPQADLLTAAGWMGLFFTGGVLWLIAFIWAYGNPTGTASTIAAGAVAGEADAASLGETRQVFEAAMERIRDLESQVATLTAKGGEGS